MDYQWTLEPDHVPGITAEEKGDLISYAWAIAYIKALIAAAYGETDMRSRTRHVASLDEGAGGQSLSTTQMLR